MSIAVLTVMIRSQSDTIPCLGLHERYWHQLGAVAKANIFSCEKEEVGFLLVNSLFPNICYFSPLTPCF